MVPDGTPAAAPSHRSKRRTPEIGISPGIEEGGWENPCPILRLELLSPNLELEKGLITERSGIQQSTTTRAADAVTERRRASEKKEDSRERVRLMNRDLERERVGVGVSEEDKGGDYILFLLLLIYLFIYLIN